MTYITMGNNSNEHDAVEATLMTLSKHYLLSFQTLLHEL